MSIPDGQRPDPGSGRQPSAHAAYAAMFLLQRDWAREETVADVVEIVLTERLLRG